MISKTKREFVSRVFVLVLVPALLLLFSAGYAEITRVAFPLAMLIVFGSAVAVMVTLTLLCQELVTRPTARGKFSLYTVMLAIVPVAIYLSGFRQLLNASRASLIPPGQIAVMLILFGVFGLISCVMLLYLAEALMWLFLKTRQRGTSRS